MNNNEKSATTAEEFVTLTKDTSTSELSFTAT